jgi:CheY-like chemotaxis protein
MDIQMPDMDGLETIRHLRLIPDLGLASVPVIAITALAMPGDRERCLEAGANEYISKPIRLKELVSMIQRILVDMKSSDEQTSYSPGYR